MDNKFACDLKITLALLSLSHCSALFNTAPVNSPKLGKFYEWQNSHWEEASRKIGIILSSLLYPVKFLHRESAPDYQDIPVIMQLRTQAILLQRQGDFECPQTKQELTVLNRWLDW